MGPLQSTLPNYLHLFRLAKPIVSSINSITFDASDNRKGHVSRVEVFAQGDITQCKFFRKSQEFTIPLKKCTESKRIIARLYNLSEDDLKDFDLKMESAAKPKKKFKNVGMTYCTSNLDDLRSDQNFGLTASLTYSYPTGRNMADLCLVGDKLNEEYNCKEFLPKVALNTLNLLSVLYSGKQYYPHLNLYPESFYLDTKEGELIVNLDDRSISAIPIDSSQPYPFKKDFRMLGAALLSFLIGVDVNELPNLKKRYTSPFELYIEVKTFLHSKDLELDLLSSELQENDFTFYAGKLDISEEMFNLELSKGFFGFIYTLFAEPNEPHAYTSVNSALQHQWLWNVLQEERASDNGYTTRDTNKSYFKNKSHY